MALFKILHGDSSRIDTTTTPFHEGFCYVTNDGYFYVDMNIGTAEVPNNQRICLKSDAAQKLIELNNLDEISFWVGTTKQYNALSDQEKENCLCITTDGSESVEFENISNKVTVIDENANDVTYPTTLAVLKKLTSIDGYEKTENKEVVVSAGFTDDTYASSKAIYSLVQNEVTNAKNTVLQTMENKILNVEKTTNKVTVVNADSKHTEYPSARATYEAIVAMAGDSIDKVTTIDENSTDDQLASAKATYDFVQNEINSINEIIQSQTPTIYSGTSEPDASVGKVGDLWVVTE